MTGIHIRIWAQLVSLQHSTRLKVFFKYYNQFSGLRSNMPAAEFLYYWRVFTMLPFTSSIPSARAVLSPFARLKGVLSSNFIFFEIVP